MVDLMTQPSKVKDQEEERGGRRYFCASWISTFLVKGVSVNKQKLCLPAHLLCTLTDRYGKLKCTLCCTPSIEEEIKDQARCIKYTLWSLTLNAYYIIASWNDIPKFRPEHFIVFSFSFFIFLYGVVFGEEMSRWGSIWRWKSKEELLSAFSFMLLMLTRSMLHNVPPRRRLLWCDRRRRFW